MQTLRRPQAVVIESNCRNNILKMARKAERLNASFRPHFKTHQSNIISEWFRDEGITGITVSSPEMGAYFASNGWNDITIAFPFYRNQIDDINALASDTRLRLFITHLDDIDFLSTSLTFEVDLMIEINAGYNRSGTPIRDTSHIDFIIEKINNSRNVQFKGFYIHDGDTYHVTGMKSVKEIIKRDLEAFKKLNELYPAAELSLGDTPSCSMLTDLSPATELSPGNLIFYDLMQIEIGSCTYNDLGLLIRVPVAQEKTDEDEGIIHGGAVHFSKDRLSINGHDTYGQPVNVTQNGTISKIEGTRVSALSQEHGTVKGLRALKEAYETENLQEIWICPVHSCLAANLFKNYTTLSGDIIEKRVLS